MQDKEHLLDCSLENNEHDVNIDDLSVRLQESLVKIIKREGYIEYTIKKTKVSTEGGNYLGILSEIDVSGKTKDGDKYTNIFVKEIIEDNDFASLRMKNIYQNETYAYNQLFNIYNELQDKANVPVKERYNTVRSFDETNEEAIILENLSRKGYKTIERMKVMPIEYAELCIKQLAKFHGLSFVIQNQSPEEFYQIIEQPKESVDFHGKGFLRFANNMFDVACMYLCKESGDKIKKYTESFTERLKKHLVTSAAGCCICHGDFIANNVMYKDEVSFNTFNQDGDREVIIIDFQNLHYGNLINDFMTFIFLGTDREFRKKHLEYLKDLYYESLEKFLKYFSLDVNKLYAKKEYEEYFKTGLEFGLIKSLYTLPLIFIEAKDVPDLGKIKKLREVPFTVNSQYKERIQGIVDDCIQWNIL